ncbi:MAG TPA: extracellular solute-binding protein, partial [Limnochordia bacterium]|nr:extracellular solute-binding protein [Limnochordia bacterium]
AETQLILSGDPPDVIMVPPQSVSSWAYKGLLEPLDAYLTADGVKTSDFIPPAWAYGLWQGKTYAMTLETDPNFAMLWNKDLFSKRGLDPERGPKTLAEYETAFEKLTELDANGNAQTVGGEPWAVYGHNNTFITWSWIFGGKLYDPATGKITADDPRNVEALAFIHDYYKRYRSALAPSDFPGLDAGNDLVTGNPRVGMTFSVTSNFLSLVKNHPDANIGIDYEPYIPGQSQPNPAWLGGWAVAIPKGAKNPKLSWQFIKQMTATAEGTQTFAEPSGWVPVYLPSPIFKKYLADPYMKVYAQIAQTAQHHTPSIPVYADYGTAADQAVADVLADKKLPKDALAFVDQVVQQKLDAALAK